MSEKQQRRKRRGFGKTFYGRLYSLAGLSHFARGLLSSEDVEMVRRVYNNGRTIILFFFLGGRRDILCFVVYFL